MQDVVISSKYFYLTIIISIYNF